MLNKNIYLIGPMGAGKSAIGRQLAVRLGRDFYDSDEVIEERTGASVGWIFDVEGEEGFRQREINVITELTQMQNIVLSTGGGTITREENCQKLAAFGFVVYLSLDIEYQYQRTVSDYRQRRPLLEGGDRRQRLLELHQQRTPIYERLAEFSVETGGKKIQDVVQVILNHLSKESI